MASMIIKKTLSMALMTNRNIDDIVLLILLLPKVI
jgi:hypothetical protein